MLFWTVGDYATFEEVLLEAREKFAIRLPSYCSMPNHWHLLVKPESDGELSRFMQWLTLTHSHRYSAFHRMAGTGPIYQGRFKSIPVALDSHCLWAHRYIERNPLRAGLVSRAEDWRGSSLWHRSRATNIHFDDPPVALPEDWISYVNQPQTLQELGTLRERIAKGVPLGADAWVRAVATELGLPNQMREKVPDTFFTRTLPGDRRLRCGRSPTVDRRFASAVRGRDRHQTT
jgi:putative transposase